ncbi:MAG: S-methyl-5-thioribose-1-phosphate isomerase [Omnitrophica WOR_2 bacterium RIFCSPLOWO2_12_FULL_51_24]|nr:MAG: S-methyl-5-thioribose-1-phosphate isomerase [Omnitrophica WOR_2 bacterium RIFCSPHIGHO2_01_FULL_49_10]OGX33599.1 MAG: S-methyl-5-thioribose-1-phosphate isomerase [Omnitrophica WOR_2 bacterium RIFCSPLOWO2_02_FULL_50_19]OGX42705.1 MAG: S-methyl-5-thioribose-1-phosphate isomerase [Omnitrophica WOR_2 bacterium RIFCSPLOWO2_12_FULL_51_24]
MAIQTIKWDKGAVKIIDQTLLPNKFVYLKFRDVKDFWHAIKKLQVRGAPALGVASAYGAYLGIQHSHAKNYTEFIRELDRVIKFIGSARPTAVNLFWGLARMRAAAVNNKKKPVSAIKKELLAEAHKVYEEDRAICRKMADYGARLIKNGDVILTHCNAGALATADYGTALGVIYRAKEQGKRIKVYADETRPLLQGARLTTWELMREGIDVTLICDNMAAHIMSQGKVTKVVVGADRITRNGDAANKIGTYGVAVLAKYHKIPFYVVAPVSTIDFNLSHGRHIPIEERRGEEITTIHGKMLAPRGVKTYCPAFDVTPAKLITAIVTEKGVFKPDEIKKIR